MPCLRYRNADGLPAEIWLDLQEGPGGRFPPLTLGAAPAARGHVHVPGAAMDARLVGSGQSQAYAFVLWGPGVEVNGRPLEPIRVLRHGDRIRMGPAELVYLDFFHRSADAGAALLDRRCASPACSRPLSAPTIACPWCGALYHAGCWLELERCVEKVGGCYPVRRMLLAELAAEVRSEKIAEEPSVTQRLCTARCAPEKIEIRVGEEILRCPQCRSPYHPGCFLAMRGPCLQCGFDLPELIDRRTFRLGEEGP